MLPYVVSMTPNKIGGLDGSKPLMLRFSKHATSPVARCSPTPTLFSHAAATCATRKAGERFEAPGEMLPPDVSG
jgi:hypothetical protein